MAGTDRDSGVSLPDSDATAPPPADAYDVPATAGGADCPDCGRTFPDERQRTLHRGLEHGGHLDADDAERVADAREHERRRLRLFRLKALAVLVLLYFGLLMVYAFVL